MHAPLGERAAARRFLFLTCTRWLPVGLTFGMTVLLPAERGIPLGELGIILAVQGIVTLLLEVPTGSVADTWGRRPLLVLAGCLAVLATALFLLADSLWLFALASALQGVYRALDSGPLESWYVDTAQAAAPGVAIERTLARAGTVLGLALAGGAVVGGALVAWHPLPHGSALLLPFLVSLGFSVAHTVFTAVLVREPRRGSRHGGPVPDGVVPGEGGDGTVPDGVASGIVPDGVVPAEGGDRTVRGARASAPAAVGAGTGREPAPGARGMRALLRTTASGLGLLRRSRVLRCLVLVEVFWALAMIGFETLTPLRLTDLLGSEASAAALFAPASGAAWALFAAGSWLSGLASARWGVATGAMVARVANGIFVVLMGLSAGVIGLLAAYALSYLSHGAAGPLHNTLLHRCASSENRSVVLSLNSMVSSGAYSLAFLIVLPAAQAWGTGVVLVALGALSVLGVVFYLPARRAEREAVPHPRGVVRAS
jgi:predicted MFS family arabinose efflux permease